jgi:hypothetical protein
MKEVSYGTNYFSKEICDCFVVGYLLGLGMDRLYDNC